VKLYKAHLLPLQA